MSKCVYVCVGTCMRVCVWYTELTCIPNVWPSGHYGSGPRSFVCLCVSVCVCVGTCMLVCVWYTEFTSKPDV